MSALIVNFRLSRGQEWARWAECAKPDAAPMFPSDADEAGIVAAKDNCRVCPVLVECLESALAKGEQWGVWGGLTTDERAAIRRNEARQARRTGDARATAAELADAAARGFTDARDVAEQLDASAGQMADAGVA